MLAVPFKRACRVDIAKPLKSYLKHECSSTEVEDNQENLKVLQQLRIDAAAVVHATDVGLEVLEKYYHQLCSLDKRFPVSESQIKIGFTWYDCLKPAKKHALYSISYEVACVLFNMAASHSHLGVGKDRSSTDGLKASAMHFKTSAGVYKHLRETVVTGLVGRLPLDLSTHALNMFEQLMLAQAQSCFYEKAVRDGMADGVIAKLGAQTSAFYEAAVGHADAMAAHGLDRSWLVNLRYQTATFGAAAQFYQSKVDKAEAAKKLTGYGVEVARLVDAEAAVAAAVRTGVAGRLPEGVLGVGRALLAEISKSKEMAVDYNSTIYHEPVPDMSTLPPIAKAVVVQSTPFTSASTDPELFPRIVPVSVMMAASAVTQRVEAAGRETANGASKANEETRTKLASLGLPAAVEAHGHGTGLSENVWVKVSGVQQGMASHPSLSALAADNGRAADEAEQTLQRCDALLADEETEDNQCRAQYGTRWDRQSSAVLSRSLRDDIARYTKLLRDGRRSDEVVGTKLAQRGGELSLLQSSRQALDSMMPPPSDASEGEAAANASAARLATLLVEMGRLVQEREKISEDMLTYIRGYDGVAAIIGHPGTATAVDPVFAELDAQRLRPAAEALAAANSRAAPLMDRIVAENTVFVSARASDEATQRREGVVAQLLAAVQLYEELRSQLKEGGVFWEQVQQRCSQLLQTVTDHCYTRTLEKQELTMSMNSAAAPQAGGGVVAGVPVGGMGGINMGAAPQAPPAHSGSFSARASFGGNNDVSGDAELAAKLQAELNAADSTAATADPKPSSSSSSIRSFFGFGRKNEEDKPSEPPVQGVPVAAIPAGPPPAFPGTAAPAGTAPGYQPGYIYPASAGSAPGYPGAAGTAPPPPAYASAAGARPPAAGGHNAMMGGGAARAPPAYGQPPAAAAAGWRCPMCTYENPASAANACEMCGQKR